MPAAEEKKETDENENSPLLPASGAFRTGVVPNLPTRQKRLERLPGNRVPEIHFVGQINFGIGLIGSLSDGVSCRWKVEYGSTMEKLSGEDCGHTQVAYANISGNEAIPFNHPIDLHFARVGLQGWGAPRLCLQCFRYDEFGRRIIIGYGFSSLSTISGYQQTQIQLWRPAGTAEQELDAYFLGKTPALSNPQETLYSNAWRDRCRLVTIPSGSVVVSMMVVTRFQSEQLLDEA